MFILSYKKCCWPLRCAALPVKDLRKLNPLDQKMSTSVTFLLLKSKLKMENTESIYAARSLSRMVESAEVYVGLRRFRAKSPLNVLLLFELSSVSLFRELQETQSLKRIFPAK